jgi:hypothetical protein
VSYLTTRVRASPRARAGEWRHTDSGRLLKGVITAQLLALSSKPWSGRVEMFGVGAI